MILLLGSMLALAAPPANPAPDAAANELPLEQLEARAAYRLGLELITAEKWTEACRALAIVYQQHPDDALADKAREQAGLLGAAHPDTGCGSVPLVGQRRTVRDEDSGRTELIVSQAIAGPVLLGGFVPAATVSDLQTPLYPVLMGFTGLGLGIGVPLAITAKSDVRTGQAMAVYTGEIVGGFHGLGLFYAAYPRRFPTTKTPFQFVAAGTAAGLAGGALVAVKLDPSAGDMAMFRSGMAWGTAYGGLSFAFFEPSVRSPTEAPLRLLAFSDVGAAVGTVLAVTGDASRSRVNLINLSGYAGALFGGGIAILAEFYAETGDPALSGGIVTATTTVGLVGGVLLTQGGQRVAALDRFTLPVIAPRVEADGSLGAQAQLGGRW